MTIQQAADDIRTMRVRGAAKIGRHAARALGAWAPAWDGSDGALDAAAAMLVAARPTAVSLPNAVRFVVQRAKKAPAADRPRALGEAAADFERRAETALDDIGRHGAALIPENGTVLTICNSQGALAPLIEAHKAGRRFHAIAFETRPWRQGLLTAKQLAEAGIDASFAVDSAMWLLLQDADLVLVGADTWARNGDVINKIGTGALAACAHERGVPFYSCAETFKVDAKSPTGADVHIEERESSEVAHEGELPKAIRIRNPVFDITPSRFVKGYVTEAGILKAADLWPTAQKAWELG